MLKHNFNFHIHNVSFIYRFHEINENYSKNYYIIPIILEYKN